MKKGWEYKKLGEVANINHGKNQKEVLDVHGKYPIYGSGGNIMGYANSYLCDAGTTILGRKGTINNPVFIETKFWNVDTAFGITAKDGTDKKFIFYFVKSQDWSKKDTGTTLPSLTQKVVKETIIPVPSLSEQQRIVSYLDSAFAKIDAVAKNAEDSLNEAKALFQSALAKMMEPKEGWEYKKLGEVCNVIGGGTPDKKNKNYYGGNIPWATVRDMNNKYVEQTEYSITEEGLEKSSSNIIHNGEVIIATRVGLGKACILKHDTAINQDLKGIIPKQNDINRTFLYYWFKFESKNIISNGVGATVKGVKLSFINNLTFPCIPLSEQQRIASQLDSLRSKVDQLQSNLSRTLAECAALKQAILRQTFEQDGGNTI